jgi:predicted Rossmann fold flavoprotein
MSSEKTLIVIGAGAAGFFCAVNAARRDRSLKVIIVEKTNKLLSKVRVSGGGRCNVTHACFDIAEMSKRYPRGSNFVKKAFHQFFTTDTIHWFEERGVKLKTEKDGRMFPVTDSSQTIIDCLLKESNKYSVEIMMRSEVKGITTSEGRFHVQLDGGRTLTADHVCVASGGYPKKELFDWLLATGHSLEKPVPSLFTFNVPNHPLNELMGVSVNHVTIKIAGTKLEQEGPLLITHWGLSGPAVLRLSAWGARELAEKQYDFTVRINWMGDKKYNEQRLKVEWKHFREIYAAKKLANQNVAELPSRLWEYLLVASGVSKEMRFADIPGKAENVLIKNLVDFNLPVKGKTTFKEEFVTAGGIRIGEIDPNTMMSKLCPGLYFAGEVMDVDGITGGYNFQHAWTSGWVVGKSIVSSR